MSYIDLKHLLADLALEAVGQPDRAAWAAVAAAYAATVDGTQFNVSWETLRPRATQMAETLGWRPRLQDIAHLAERGLLDRRDATFALRPQFRPYLGYFRQQTSRLLDAVRFLTREPLRRDGRDLQRGVALFNAGLFFECHELVEGLWKASPGPDKGFYHGIVQAAAAFYHYEKHNRHGAVTLLTKAIPKLASYPSPYLGIDLESFRLSLQPWAAAFRTTDGGNRPPMLPHISWART